MDYSHSTKEEIIDGIKKNILQLSYLSTELTDDNEVVAEAVKHDEDALLYASERLRDDKEIVLEAAYNNPLVLDYASERLQNNKEILEILEKLDISEWELSNKEWFNGRMEVLTNIREKELMEKYITSSNKSYKQLKF